MPSTSSGFAKGFRCPSCTKTFSRQEHVKRHQMQHTKEKPFCCRVCKRRYVRQDVLARHVRMFHDLGSSSVDDMVEYDDSHSRSNSKSSPGEPMAESSTTSTGDGSASPQASQEPLATSIVRRPRQDMVPPRTKDRVIDIDEVPVDDCTERLDHDLSEALFTEPFFQLDGSSTAIFLPADDIRDQSLSSLMLEQSMPSYCGFMEGLELEPPACGPFTFNVAADFAADEGPCRPDTQANSFGALSQKGQIDRKVRMSRSGFLRRLEASGIEPDQGVAATFPVDATLLRQIGLFFRCFSPHFPFIPARSFSISESHPVLVLMVAAIGGRYAFENETANMLYLLARRALDFTQQTASLAGDRPTELWALQAELLGQMYLFWGASPAEWKMTSTSMGFIARHILRLAWRAQKALDERVSHMISNEKLLHFEEVKRAFFAAFIFSTLRALYRDERPALLSRDCEGLYLPCSEGEWLAMPLHDKVITSESSSEAPCLGTKFDALMEIISSGGAIPCNPLQMRIVIAAMKLDVWCSSGLSSVRSSAFGGMWSSSVWRFLRNWEEAISAIDQQPPVAVSMSRENPVEHHPLVLDAIGAARITQVHLTIRLDAVFEFLRSGSQTKAAAASFLGAMENAIERSPAVTAAIRCCYEALDTFLGLGSNFIQNVSIFMTWGIEHALYSATLTIVACCWLKKVQRVDDMDIEEATLSADLRQFLFDHDATDQVPADTSRALLELWSRLMTKTMSPWKITKSLADTLTLCHSIPA